MSMADEIISVPFSEDELEDDQETYRTYKMDFAHRRIGGMVDDKEAVLQAIWKMMSTVRFAHLIYDDQYGCDILNKINNGLTPTYLENDLPAMLEDTFATDDRITGVSDLTYEILSPDSVHVQFTAATVYGDVEVEGVITRNGD